MAITSRVSVDPKEPNPELDRIAAEIYSLLEPNSFWEDFTHNRALFSMRIQNGNTYSNAASEAMNKVSKSVDMYNRGYFDAKATSSNFYNATAPLLFMIAVVDLDDDHLNSYRQSGLTIPPKLIETRDSYLKAKDAVLKSNTKKAREQLTVVSKELIDCLSEIKASKPAIGGKHVDILIKVSEFCKEVEKGGPGAAAGASR